MIMPKKPMKNLVECIPVLELLCPKYRLCMVRVKPFPKRKMFSCVWLHFKKFSGKYFLMFGKEEGKDKPKKNIINDRNPRSRSRQRDLAKARSRLTARSRDGARSRRQSRDRDLRGDRRTGDRRRLELRVRRRSSD